MRQSEITNYEVNKLVRHTVQPKGTVRRLSVAVILDHRTVYKESKDGNKVAVAEPRSQNDLDAYRQLVQAAIGYNQQRGDVVTIQNVPFFSEYRPEEPQAPVPMLIRWQNYVSPAMPALKYLSFLSLFLLAYFGLFRPILNRVLPSVSTRGNENVQAVLEAGNVPQALSGAQQPEAIAPPAGITAGAIPSATEAALPDQTFATADDEIERELMKEANLVELGTRKHAVIKKKLVEKAIKEPELISQLLRSLLNEKA